MGEFPLRDRESERHARSEHECLALSFSKAIRGRRDD
jgi:hypothetical protein